MLLVDFWKGICCQLHIYFVLIAASYAVIQHSIYFVCYLLFVATVEPQKMGNKSQLDELNVWFKKLGLVVKIENKYNQIGLTCGYVAANVLHRISQGIKNSEDLFAIHTDDCVLESVMHSSMRLLYPLVDPNDTQTGSFSVSLGDEECVKLLKSLSKNEMKPCILPRHTQLESEALSDDVRTDGSVFVAVIPFDVMLGSIVREVLKFKESIDMKDDYLYFCVSKNDSKNSEAPSNHWYSVVLQMKHKVNNSKLKS